jgi:hypothetical protein
MKPLQSPNYTQRRSYTPCHAAPGGGLCPQCGQFATSYNSQPIGDMQKQYRRCQCGNRFTTVVRRQS